MGALAYVPELSNKPELPTADTIHSLLKELNHHIPYRLTEILSHIPLLGRLIKHYLEAQAGKKATVLNELEKVFKKIRIDNCEDETLIKAYDAASKVLSQSFQNKVETLFKTPYSKRTQYSQFKEKVKRDIERLFSDLLDANDPIAEHLPLYLSFAQKSKDELKTLIELFPKDVRISTTATIDSLRKKLEELENELEKNPKLLASFSEIGDKKLGLAVCLEQGFRIDLSDYKNLTIKKRTL